MEMKRFNKISVDGRVMVEHIYRKGNKLMDYFAKAIHFVGTISYLNFIVKIVDSSTFSSDFCLDDYTGAEEVLHGLDFIAPIKSEGVLYEIGPSSAEREPSQNYRE
ncbi:hypothetical protein HAX54_044276 [Datura stramonium]|uniref:Uncharacterized protein n=1 Tax=Datura stramonium TaxID=4076 RepID=A0ABS8SP02_DATST|nr:hypothetical protein [Datura stramonium]